MNIQRYVEHMSATVKVPCAECGRAIELQQRSLSRYYKRNNTDQYICASCTASKTGKRQVPESERIKRSANATALWQNNDYRSKVMISHQQVTSQTEFKRKVSENNKKRWQNLEYRKKMEDKNAKEDEKINKTPPEKPANDGEQYKRNVLESKFKKDELG